MVGPKTAGIVAAVKDVQLAFQLKAQEKRGREPVNREPAMRDGDPPVAPAVTAALPLPTASHGIDLPLREQAADQRLTAHPLPCIKEGGPGLGLLPFRLRNRRSQTPAPNG